MSESDRRIARAAAEGAPPIVSGGCEHPQCLVNFDYDRARGMTVAEVRREFPRFFGACKDCGRMVIKYASYTHYVSGDW